ncbi:MAG: lysophospholipid acyltransferase family protein [Candidatus Euphemobacter frigidus]|nr:lysophospholipid acyltransferase family protein [Candidatus Euphemobacter frigidus]MDP8275169.1 lysophospholipid acyltransferase family protein [Candidatus Euphemobacter frigidus]
MFSYWLLILLRGFLCLLPARPARALGRFLGEAAYYFDGKHRAIARENLRRSFPEKINSGELRRLARRSFGQMGFNMVELLRIPRFIRPGWQINFRVRGEEHLQAAFGRGEGIIFVLSHFGNWEYLGFMPRLLSFRGAAVGQKIKNPAVDGMIKDLRELIGLELFSKQEVVSEVTGYLRKNGAVAILADQRARKMSVEVTFFGRPALTTVAPAVLALKTGAALIPVFIYFEADGCYQVVFEREVPVPQGLPLQEAVREVTRRFTAIFEKKIRERPELWFWVHRRWQK